MQKAPIIEGPVGVSATKQRFLLLNRERLRRAQESMRERQQDFLDLLPLLFHVNHPILPGFVSSEGPVGVSDYRPTNRALHAAKKIAMSFDYKRKALPRYDIDSLFLMGSGGTIAYSQKSDFDIWLCHRPDMDAAKLAELQHKATLIEEWAGTLDLEVHFFLINPHHFRQGRHADLSSESSGTAQHYLLLEEFYRTGLLLAGRYPVWWLVPPDQETRYNEYVRELIERRHITLHEFVDFGSVHLIPAEEFFGAALWQLFKGIDSPYKSVLKLLLMELYASQYPKIELLCLRFKRAIYAGETHLDQLDPYIMLYRALEEHLERNGEHERLDFVRRCFYFKVNEKLSVPDHPRYTTWRRDVVRSLAESWGWGGVYLEMLDSRSSWKINRVVRERQVLVSELTHSYRILSNFVREQAALMSSINQKDITVLGRKLYAAFERKAGKVEIINRGISDDLWEDRITLLQIVSRDGEESWALYRGAVTAAEIAHSPPLKRGRGVCELMAWGYFNGLIDERTALALYAQKGELTVRELVNMVRCFQRLFPLGAAMETDINDLARPAAVVAAGVFVNVGVDPLQQHTRSGKHLTTARTDALSYSGLGENLALTFDLVLVTSWKEVLTFRHIGVEGLLNCLGEYFQWAPPSGGIPPPSPAVFCLSSPRGEAIGRRIKELFDDLMVCYYKDAMGSVTRYVLGVEQTFYSLYVDNDVLRHKQIGGYDRLLAHLAEGRTVYSPVIIDRHALPDTLLPAIFKLNRPGVIQVVYRIDGPTAEVYVLDERGSLFNQRVSFFDRGALVDHFRVFFDAVLNRQHFDISVNNSDMPALEVEFYEANKDEVTGRRKLVQVHVEPGQRVRHYFKVQVIGEVLGTGQPSFTVYCNEVEFAGLAYGERLFSEVATYVLRQRRSGQRYPIYITDIDGPRSMFGGEPGGRVQTIHFLNYKKQIEQWLNDAVAARDNDK